jgi:hypothetical protein
MFKVTKTASGLTLERCRYWRGTVTRAYRLEQLDSGRVEQILLNNDCCDDSVAAALAALSAGKTVAVISGSGRLSYVS